MGRIGRFFWVAITFVAIFGLRIGSAFAVDEFVDERPPQQGVCALSLGTPAGLYLTLAGGMGSKWGP